MSTTSVSIPEPKARLEVDITRVKEIIYRMQTVAREIPHAEERKEIETALTQAWSSAERVQWAIKRN